MPLQEWPAVVTDAYKSGGMAITLVTHYDVDRVKQIEATSIYKKLVEFETNENEVLPLLRAVMVAKGEVQSCCFANQTYCFFSVLVAVAVVVAKAP